MYIHSLFRECIRFSADWLLGIAPLEAKNKKQKSRGGVRGGLFGQMRIRWIDQIGQVLTVRQTVFEPLTHGHGTPLSPSSFSTRFVFYHPWISTTSFHPSTRPAPPGGPSIQTMDYSTSSKVVHSQRTHASARKATHASSCKNGCKARWLNRTKIAESLFNVAISNWCMQSTFVTEVKAKSTKKKN